MKRIGKVVGATQGLAVLRVPDAEYPDIGTTALTDQLDSVGTVVDVFGPVERPYVAISPDDERVAQFVGEMLYARTS